LKSKKSLEILGTLEVIHKFPAKEDQKFEFPLKIEFGLIFAIV
jgi:hypothetical protein